MLHTFTLHRTDRFNEYVYLINTFRVLLKSVKCILTSFCFVNLSKLKPPYFIRIKDFLAPNVIYHEIDNPPTPFPRQRMLTNKILFVTVSFRIYNTCPNKGNRVFL